MWHEHVSNAKGTAFKRGLLRVCLEFFILGAVYQFFHSIFLAILALVLSRVGIDFILGLGEGMMDELRAAREDGVR